MENCIELKKKTVETELNIEGMGKIILSQRPLTTPEYLEYEAMQPDPLTVPELFDTIVKRRNLEAKKEDIVDSEGYDEECENTKRRIKAIDQELLELGGVSKLKQFSRDNKDNYFKAACFVVEKSLTPHKYLGGEIKGDLPLDLLFDLLPSGIINELKNKAIDLSILSDEEKEDVK